MSTNSQQQQQRVFDLRTRHQRGRYAVYYEDSYGEVCVDIYSSRERVIRGMLCLPWVEQVCYNGYGKVIAHVRDGKIWKGGGI